MFFSSSVILTCQHWMQGGVGRCQLKGPFLKGLEMGGGTMKIAERENGGNDMNGHRRAQGLGCQKTGHSNGKGSVPEGLC